MQVENVVFSSKFCHDTSYFFSDFDEVFFDYLMSHFSLNVGAMSLLQPFADLAFVSKGVTIEVMRNFFEHRPSSRGSASRLRNECYLFIHA